MLVELIRTGRELLNEDRNSARYKLWKNDVEHFVRENFDAGIVEILQNGFRPRRVARGESDAEQMHRQRVVATIGFLEELQKRSDPKVEAPGKDRGTELGVDRNIAAGIARYWSGGTGPSHSTISTAFSLAGYEEPEEADPEASPSKHDRVEYALRHSDGDEGKVLVEELLSALRTHGDFDDISDRRLANLRVAFERHRYRLDDGGYVDWTPGQVRTAKSEDVEPPKSTETSSGPLEYAIPTIELLVASLRRLASALRPLVVRRRERQKFEVKDEYDLQDLVEALLRCFFNDVRPEERTPSYAGSSSTMDFLLRDDNIAIEVKVTRPGRSDKQVKQELLVDIHDYQEHPSVRRLVAVVYDLHATFSNPAGFEKDLTKKHNDLDVQVIVVGWPLPI